MLKWSTYTVASCWPKRKLGCEENARRAGSYNTTEKQQLGRKKTRQESTFSGSLGQ